MFSQGLIIMFIGMSVVFVFLFIMVLIMNLSAGFVKISNKFFPEPVEAETNLQKAIVNNEDIAVAIAVVKNLS